MPNLGSPSPSPDAPEQATSSTDDNDVSSPELFVSTSRHKGKKSNIVKSGDAASSATVDNEGLPASSSSKSIDLNEKIRLFKRNVAKLHKTHENMVRRAEKLERREQELEARELLYADRASSLDPTLADDGVDTTIERAELDLLKEELDRKARSIEQRNAELSKREAELLAAEAIADKRALDAAPDSDVDAEITSQDAHANIADQAELDQRREQLDQRAQELDRRAQALNTLEQSLQPDLEKLGEKQKAFRKETGQSKRHLTLREKEIHSDEQTLDDREIELQAVRDELDRQQEECDVLQSELAAREASLNERWERLEQQSADLDRRAAESLDINAILDQREQAIAVREAALNRVADSLDQQKRNAERTKQLIELRRKRVTKLRDHVARTSRRARRKARRRMFLDGGTVSIGPDDTLSPPSSNLGSNSDSDSETAKQSAVTTIARTDEEPLTDPLSEVEKRIMITLAVVLTLFAGIAAASYLLAGVLTSPTWRGTLVLSPGPVTNVSSLTDAELAESLHYFSTRGLRPAEDSESLRQNLANNLTITSDGTRVTLAYFSRDKKASTIMLQGLQKGLELHRGDSMRVVSAAAVDPDPFDDPQMRITYVLFAIGTLTAAIGFLCIRWVARKRASD